MFTDQLTLVMRFLALSFLIALQPVQSARAELAVAVSVTDNATPSAVDCNGYVDLAGRKAFLRLAACEALKSGLPREIAQTVMEIESGFHPHARGGDGEVGLMQILPSTARLLGFKGTIDELADPINNVRFGVRYLSQAWRLAGSDLCTALMKYRAGHAETRFSYLSVQYCVRARAILLREGFDVSGDVPKATFGLAVGTAGGGGGACLRRSFVPGPGYGRCLRAGKNISNAKITALRRGIFGN